MILYCNQSLTFSQSIRSFCLYRFGALQERYGEGLKKHFLKEMQHCCVLAAGTSLSIVKHAANELCVDINAGSCSCHTFKSLKICCHVLVVLKTKSHEVVKVYVERHFGQGNIPLPGLANSGQKPGANKRKGGRTKTATAVASVADSIRGGYVVIRKARKHKKCHGCGKDLESSLTHIIRHYCAPKFKKKNIFTGETEIRYGTRANHHFHLNIDCVKLSEQHNTFDGHVLLEATLTLTPKLKTDLALGNLIIH